MQFSEYETERIWKNVTDKTVLFELWEVNLTVECRLADVCVLFCKKLHNFFN